MAAPAAAVAMVGDESDLLSPRWIDSEGLTLPKLWRVMMTFRLGRALRADMLALYSGTAVSSIFSVSNENCLRISELVTLAR